MSNPALPDPATALAASLARLRRRAGRSALFMLAMSTGIALLLAAIEGRGFGSKLIYSLAIGGCCWGVHEGTRVALAAGCDALHRARGLTPRPDGWNRGWNGVLASMVVTVPLGPLLGTRLGDALTGFNTPSLLDLQQGNTRVTLVLTLLGTLVAVAVLSTLERLHAARAQAEAAQRLAAENQLRLLQSQLEPHMLFNTLANLRVLITLDPPRAQAMLDRLIGFLRSTLAASRAESHPLSAEFERTADYLALMGVRMGDRLQSALQLPPDLAGVPVPPLLLQPLVENSIQHGLEPQVAGGRIDVAAAREGATLVLTVRDTGAGPGAGTPGSGFGLTQVRERLSTLYGDRASFTFGAAAGGGAIATLKLPLN